MNAKLNSGDNGWIDPDDAPTLDGAFFDRAEVRDGETLVRRGRPKSDSPKRQVTLRLDGDIIDAFKADGAGWQSRINDALKDAIGRGRP